MKRCPGVHGTSCERFAREDKDRCRTCADIARTKLPAVVAQVMRMLYARGVPIKELRADLAPGVSYERVRQACVWKPRERR
jgi:hypothetical protein